MSTSTQHDNSPFHAGEQALQTRMGVRDNMERFGRRVIRPFMPEQHQAFYSQLPFVLAAHVDQDGWPWASILHAPAPHKDARFMHAVDDTHLRFDCKPLEGDPLADALTGKNVDKLHIGLMGIELPTRRRNRMAAHVVERDQAGFTLKVDQCFGNCPQYIQSRDVHMLDPATMPAAITENLTELDEEAIAFIQQADTFFVASYYVDKHNPSAASNGADVSHRGGKPGFVRLDNKRTLTIPDYLGNNHFNTLGNIQETGKAGLLFIDFDNGDLLTLTGKAELLPDSDETNHFKGAERLWRFELTQARRLRNSLPLRWSFNDYSPNSLLTGSWAEADQIATSERLRNQWLSAEVIKVQNESSTIKSFYLRPNEGGIAHFEAGQFLSLSVNVDGQDQIRTYTVSSAPADDFYRISVKRENLVSGFLHDNIKTGDHIQIKAPNGSFHWNHDSERPVVMLAAGVGITPMVSMARHGFYEMVRTRNSRSITLINAARDTQQRAFYKELQQLQQQSAGNIEVHWALSQPQAFPANGSHNEHYYHGRINKELLQSVLPMDDYEFYLCGPPAFMQSMYDLLRELGVTDRRIQAEEFGPASLKRDREQLTELEPVDEPEAEQAVINFIDAESGATVEQQWSPADGNLLEFAEAHGFTPEYGCRSGQCGACKTRLRDGRVVQAGADVSLLAEDEVLLCCAKPAAREDGGLAQVTLILD
ncbi:hypothetical protein R50073_16250 [Maricurvus nonylphenolicus]|uniref:pyridoxamine 5'-phosphate oxidase family protein n=1 Tax=Maricurvus nonylphenolicus TaxID=1008307 RepID=UPI0036F38F94